MTYNVDINSPSFIIRDGMLDRLKQLPTFQGVRRWSTTPAFRVQSQLDANQIPYVSCYLIDERLEPDGDANHAEPRFIHTVRVGFSVVITSSDDTVAEQNLDSAHWTIMRTLENPRWHKFPADGVWNNGNDLRIEGVTRGSRKHIFGNKAINNETPVAELQMDLTFVHRSSFPPHPFDDLDRIHVTVAHPWPYNPNAEESFTVEYDLPIQGEFTANNYDLFSPNFATPPLSPPAPYWMPSPIFDMPALSTTAPPPVPPYSLASPSFATPTLS
jgi:hypothetical protein